MKFLFNSLTAIIRAASPAIFSFVETTLPYTTPMPIALITMTSAGIFFGLKGFGAFLFVYSLEGIGLVATSKLVETIVDFIRSRNTKTFIMIVVLAIAVYVYITILVSLNVKIHTEIEDINFSQALTLICYLPLLAGILNGLGLVKIEYLQTVENTQTVEEKRHQESREDKMKRWMIKNGLNPEQPNNSPQDAPRQERRGKEPGDFKDYVFELLDQYNGELKLTQITELVNKNKRVQFSHDKAKGTWWKYVDEWKRSRGR